MNRRNAPELDLMRRLQGELTPSEVEALEVRLARDPVLDDKFRRWQRIWQGMALPPAQEAPPGFAARLVESFEDEIRARLPAWSKAPLWVRAAAACALTAGVILGAATAAQRSQPSHLPVLEDTYYGAQPTLAETYWLNFLEEMPTEHGPEGSGS